MFLRNTYNYAVGFVEIEVEGYFVERFINLCMNKGIEVWDINRKYDGVISLKIKNSEFNKTDEIAEVTRSRVTILKREGIPEIARVYNKRKLFIIISAIVGIIIYFCSLRIWEIKIIGNTNIATEEIRNELLLENVKVGMKKSELNFDKVKNNIYLRRSDILWIGFEIKGTKATVEILERIDPKKDILADVPCNIISNKDGIIEKISVRDGTKMANVGDVIYKGDLLVSGVVSSEYSEDRYVHSDAEIYLKTWYIGKKSVPFEKTLVTKTGNVENEYKIKLGNSIINLINNGTNFEKYDTISNVKKLTLFGVIEVPLELMTTTYEEFVTDEVKYTKEQALNIAKEEASNLAKQSIPNDAQIKDTEYKVFYTDDEVIVRVTIECRENVGIKEKL